MANYTSIGDHLTVERMVAFNKARLTQYAERTKQTHDQAMAECIRTYGQRQDQSAVNAMIDAVVDVEYQTINRPGPNKQLTLL